MTVVIGRWYVVSINKFILCQPQLVIMVAIITQGVIRCLYFYSAIGQDIKDMYVNHPGMYYTTSHPGKLGYQLCPKVGSHLALMLDLSLELCIL